MGTTTRDGQLHFEWYVNGLLMTSTPMHGCMVRDRHSRRRVWNPPSPPIWHTHEAKDLVDLLKIKVDIAAGIELKDWRFYSEAITSTHYTLNTGFVNLHTFTLGNGQPCEVHNSAHAFLMADPSTRKGFCVFTNHASTTICNKVGDKTACLKTALVNLNAKNPFHMRAMTRADFPTGSYDNAVGFSKTRTDNLTPDFVRQGDFSSPHMYVVRMSKLLVCTVETMTLSDGSQVNATKCDNNKVSSCVQCPFPPSWYNAADPWDLQNGGHPIHDHRQEFSFYFYQCTGSVISCVPGTAEYAAYQDAMTAM